MTGGTARTAVSWLPMDRPGHDRQNGPIAGELHAATTRVLRALSPDRPTVLSAEIGRTPRGETRIALEAEPTAAGRWYTELAPLVGLGPAHPAPEVPGGVRSWSLRPIRTDGRLPPTSLVRGWWPDHILDWAAVLACLERTPTVHMVTVTLTRVPTPRNELPLLRRIRLPKGSRVSSPVGQDGDALLKELMRLTEGLEVGTCLAQLRVLAADEESAHQIAACLLPPDTAASHRVEVADDTVTAGGGAGQQLRLRRLGAGMFVPVERAAHLMPLTVLDTEHATRFPRRPPAERVGVPTEEDSPSVLLGSAVGQEDYRIPVTNLIQHTAVTGLPGFGKSTTVMSLLSRLWREHRMPFLVIDPEKDEYMSLVSNLNGGTVLRPGRPGVRINPLAVPPGVDPAAFGAGVAEFIDAATRLSESWPLAGGVLRNVIGDLYANAEHDPPTVARLYRAMRSRIAAMPTGSRQREELQISLGERISGLLSGPNGAALAGGPNAGLDWGRLLSGPALISLSGYGDLASRQLVFGLLMAGLTGHRRAHPSVSGHLAVVEEAHMVLGGGADGTVGPAERGAATALATLRGSGQGMLLVTQTPRQLSPVVLEMVGNRITHRLPPGAVHDAGFGSASPEAQELPTLLDQGEVLVVGAGSRPRPEQVWVTPDRTVLFAHTSVVEPPPPPITDSTPEPIWCSECPSPCTGRDVLELLPLVRSRVNGHSDGAKESLEQRSASVVLAVAEVAHAQKLDSGPSPATKLYCAAAHLLTTEFADNPALVRAVPREVRKAAVRRAGQPSGRRHDIPAQED